MNVRFSLSDLTLRARILLTSLAATLVLGVMTAALAVREYQNDKLAYLYELHAARTSTAAASLRETLVSLTQIPGETLWQGDLPRDLPRQPYDNEVFVARSSRSLHLLRASPQGEGILSRSLDPELFDKAVEPVAGIPLLVVSQTGGVIYKQNENFSDTETQTVVTGVFKSQLTEGHTVFPVGKHDVAIGFREVPASNLLVITFTPLTTLLAPLRQGLRTWAVLLVPVFIIGLLLQAWVLGSISRPIKQMISFFQSLSEGNFSAAIEVPRGEFGPVFAGAAALQRAVANREERLRLFAAGLQRTLDFSRNPDLARDFRKAAERLAELLGQIVSLHPQFGELVYDAKDDVLWIRQSHSNWFSTSEGLTLLHRYLKDPHLKNGGIVKGENESTHAEALIVPIVSGRDRQGLILIPLSDRQELSELWNLAPVITNALTEMTLRCQANDLAQHEASVAHELSLARQVQERSLVVDKVDIPGLWIDSLFEPAEMVGGDWMGVFPHLGAGIVNIYVGDVTGHGIDSAFHTALVAGAVKAIEDELEESLSRRADTDLEVEIGFRADEYYNRTWRRLNRVFLDSAVNRSMTMLFLSVDVRLGRVSAVSAGHPAPLWFGATGEKSPPRSSLLVKPTPPLGSLADDDVEVFVESFALRAGDVILGFTDGFQENISMESGKIGSRALHGKARDIMAGWQQRTESPLRSLHQWTLTAGDGYARDDDVALIAFRFLGRDHFTKR